MNALSRRLVATATALALTATGVVVGAPAWAAGTVTVTGPGGTASADAEYATDVTVSGSGFQAVPNGFGGVYVLFGWVDDPAGGSWRPSAGGVVGEDYRYVPDAESSENNGYQRFLAFPGSETESSANGVLGADGSWSVGMVIPGAVFESQDREGRVTEVDCRKVTCGIITIGAHGVKNANNETFTPVSFAAAAAAPAPDAPAAAPMAGTVRVGLESASVAAGTSIVFTGQGFTPGEQVVASLDGGLTAVGPLTAGAQGEVAAALSVPREIRDGTHLLTLRGAGSGAVAEAEVAVTGGIAVASVSEAPTAPTWVLVLLLACIALAAALVVTSIVTALVRARARRRARRAAGAPIPERAAAGAAS
ncbi:hypothetical protein [Microbacterium sp. RURRCA19A]|uniref:hypothetical protein n=1 Tax=Microbacterium sp. RURRCA19A TaxID=1907391 RepID=UPI00095625C1|nr:hypothetical protein [Microbacterium sp. RURRCA19A]SIS02099.1 hypothetical protein SAMN05880568_2448 [Microbacterium sp. RURRCA19A]